MGTNKTTRPDTNHSNNGIMEQPMLSVTLMAKRLHRKVVDVEEYLENNQPPFDRDQQDRLKRMSKYMQNQRSRMKQAWKIHNDTGKLDNVDNSNIAKIVKESEDEVREAIEETKKYLTLSDQSGPAVEAKNEIEKDQKVTGQENEHNNVDATTTEMPQLHNPHIRKVDVASLPVNKIRTEKRPDQKLSRTEVTLEMVIAMVEQLLAEQDDYGVSTTEENDANKKQCNAGGGQEGKPAVDHAVDKTGTKRGQNGDQYRKERYGQWRQQKKRNTNRGKVRNPLGGLQELLCRAQKMA